jgi:hypothetical protein
VGILPVGRAFGEDPVPPSLRSFWQEEWQGLQVAMSSLVLLSAPAVSADDVWQADPFLGDYEGDWSQGVKVWPRGLVAQVVPRGEGKYQVNLLPEFDHRCPPHAVVEAKVEGKALVLDDGPWSGRIANGTFTGKGLAKNRPATFELQKLSRPSPRLGASPPEGAVVLFDGTGFDHWVGISKDGKVEEVLWKLVDGVMEVAPTLEEHAFASSIGTKKTFQDYLLHVEFRLPLFPAVIGQSRANSGIIFEDYTFHELQVLDGYGLPGYYDECGAIYNISAPYVNMCRPPHQWQSYDIIYRGPRYADDGKLLRPARISVDHNGKLVQKDVELPDSPAAQRQRQANPGSRRVGRIKLQNHGDPIQYRNIWLKELREE